jgi:hypothetical protein
MNGTLVDSNVLLDVLTEDPRWCAWSSAVLKHRTYFPSLDLLASDTK